MIAALERLKLNQEQSTLPEQVKAFGISGGGGFMALMRPIRRSKSASPRCVRRRARRNG